MANPGYPRARRLAESIRRLVSEWLEHEQADQLAGLVTVTGVRVTQDLRHATVFYTVLGPRPERAATEVALAEATGQARAHVARNLRVRYAPTLEFVPDEVPARGERVDQLLAELRRPGGGRDQDGEGGGTR